MASSRESSLKGHEDKENLEAFHIARIPDCANNPFPNKFFGPSESGAPAVNPSAARDPPASRSVILDQGQAEE
jgi:hypothetical protein